jgi:hypothetical protein
MYRHLSTRFPASDQPRTKLIRPRPQHVRSVDDELVPGWDVLFQFAETHEAAIGHPVGLAVGVGTAVAEDDALFNGVLAFWGIFVDAFNGGLGDAVVVAEAWRDVLVDGEVGWNVDSWFVHLLLVAFEGCRADFAGDGFEFFDAGGRGAELEGFLDAV